MDLDRLHEIIRETTSEFRKGAVVEKSVGLSPSGLEVTKTEFWGMPHVDDAPDDLVQVDVVFEVIGVAVDKARARRDELIAILDAYPSLDRLRGGPSYIEVGAEVGGQGAALRLFALGEVLGLWEVITPQKVGITVEATAREMAGVGFVMISGYRP